MYKFGRSITTAFLTKKLIMKTYYPLSLLAILFLYPSCDNSEDPSPNTGLGLLTKVEGFINGMPSEDINTLTYDGNQNIESIQSSQGNFATRTYEVDYGGNQVNTLTIRREFTSSGSTVTEVYDVEYQGDQITLSSADVQGRYVLTVTDDYIDTYEDHIDRENGYFNTARFVRDADNNIDTLSYFVTNATDTDLLTWQYTFTDFETEPSLNAAFNPVFNYSFGLYDPFIGLALGLKVSKDTPLTSSYRDGNGTFRAENVSANIEEQNDGLLMKLGYTIADLPDNDYHLEFEYE